LSDLFFSLEEDAAAQIALVERFARPRLENRLNGTLDQ